MAASIAKLTRRGHVDALILLGLLALTFFVRWHTLQPIENGGDPLDNWFFVKQWHYNDDCFQGYLNHHNARVGIHWLTWVCQKLFGTHPTVYFIPPLIASHVCSALTYTLGRIAFSRSVGVVATLLLLEFNPFVFASSQLRPGVFEAMYILGTAVCITVYLRRPSDSDRSCLPFFAGLCAFLAYLAKEPTLFCSVGVVLVLLISRSGHRALLLYAAPLAAGFALETLAYNLFTDYSHRLAIVMNAHGRHAPRAQEFWYLFKRFSGAEDSWRLLYYFFFAAGLHLLLSKRPIAQKAIVLIAASYLFLLTFGVRRLNPIGLWVEMRDRYLTAVAPLALLTNAVLLVSSLKKCGQLLHKASARIPHLRAMLSRAGPPAMALTLMLLSALEVWKVRQETRGKVVHALDETRRTFALVTDAYQRNLPIVGRVTQQPTPRRPWAQVRALHWAGKGFISDEALLDEAGRLPPFSYRTTVHPLNSQNSYMPGSAGSSKEVLALLKSHKECVLRLDVKGQSVRTSERGKRLPEHCSNKS